mgnify:CR=1 FL=1|tara:strand:- start:8223 stop:8420 length:198 start_codon:yes stop_codon:yes gene_type:complete
MKTQLKTGVTTIIKKGKIKVISESLNRNPLLNQPISRVKIKRKYIPKHRLTINEWFTKIFDYATL